MKTPSAPIEPQAGVASMSPEDMDAAARAEAAQELGTAMIREHLSSHLEQNPGSTFVTWIACLHPENATVAIDPRFFVPGNPWMTVFEEAKASEALPAEAVTDCGPLDSSSSEVVPSDQPAARPASRGGPIGVLIGTFILFAAVATTFALELTAYIVFLVSYPFAKTAIALHRHLNVFTVLFFALLFLVWKVLSFIDYLILYMSIIHSEILAVLCAICTTLLGCCEAGRFWHQKIRKTCHLTRWASRAKNDSIRSIPFLASIPPPSSSERASVEPAQASQDYMILPCDNDDT